MFNKGVVEAMPLCSNFTARPAKLKLGPTPETESHCFCMLDLLGFLLAIWNGQTLSCSFSSLATIASIARLRLLSLAGNKPANNVVKTTDVQTER